MQIQIKSGGQWTDITPYIAYQGLKISRNDIDGPNAGRNLNGMMIRDRVTSKIRMDITCIPMPKAVLNTINSLLNPETISVRYKDDNVASWTTKTMYSNNYSWSYYQSIQGVEYYYDFGFPLIEV